MSEDAVPYVSRLSAKSWVDRWAFLLFAFGGAAAILIAKTIGVQPIPVAAGAAIIMTAYAALTQLSGTGRLRSDQAGDNCYYLGLIFTLSSLAYAIFFFDPANTATNIVQGFGIALATTIMGLVLRVFFNQSRVDLVEIEDTARLELVDAASRLKSELSSIVVSMNDFGRQTRQSIEELRDEVLKTMQDTRNLAVETIGTAAGEATSTIREQTDVTMEHARRLAQAAQSVVGVIEGQVRALEGIEESSAAVGSSLAALAASSEQTSSAAAELAARSSELKIGQEGVRATGNDLRDSVGRLHDAVTSLGQTVETFDGKIDGMAASLSDTLAEIADAQRNATRSIARQAEEAVSLAGRHNEALEQELATSRGHVGKVHSSLVDMTDKLAKRLEAQPPR